MTSNKIISVEELWQFYNLPSNLVCIAGDNEYFNHVSPSFAQVLNFTEEELLSTPYLHLIHPDDREATSNAIKQLQNGYAVTSFQNRYQMKSGNYKWFSWTANRPDIDGNIYAVGLDCTDKIMLEEQLTQKTKVKETITYNREKEWVEIATELRDNISHLLQKSPLCFNVKERDTTNSYSVLLHSSISSLNAINEIKKLSATLLSCLSKETKLTDSINKLIEETMAAHPTAVKFHSQNFSDCGFNKKLKLSIFSIVQAQLNNIIQHAKATLVQINLEQISDKLFLSIEDNGTGFNKAKQKNGASILNIITAAEQYNGEVFIDTAPGKGCTLTVTFIESLR
ncbi:MAG: PAS domain-containing protein [Ginsengibacter sp.]